MATYPVVNTKTGDKKEVSMSVHDWDQWCADNPEWSRDYSDPSTCPMAAEVGEWRDKLRKSKLAGMKFCRKHPKHQVPVI